MNSPNLKTALSMVLFSLTFSLYGQALPNFTGTWKLDLKKSNLQAEWANGITEGVFNIVHDEPNFKPWRSFRIDSAKDVEEFQILTDGQEQSGKDETTWNLIWQQDTLLLTIKRAGMVNTVEYYLSENEEFIADEHLSSVDLSYHNLWVFIRKKD